jgi:phage tail sheath protein FI
LSSADRDDLYDVRINPIAVFPTGRFVIFGQKTLQQAKSALDRVNVRRLLLEVKRRVSSVARKLLFEANDATTRARFVGEVVPQLAIIQAQAGVEKFNVICDGTNNSSVDEEENRMNGKIVIVPTLAVEFIALDFIVTSSGVSFE